MKSMLSRCGVFILLLTVSVMGGELQKAYFGSTRPGDWIAQELTAPDGSRSTYISERLPDEGGRVVVALSVKVLAGAGEGSESKNIMHLPTSFNFASDWLSYGKFTEKMSMEYSGTSMDIDDATLEIIRASSKDYRGTVSFVGEETIDGYVCDHYTYSMGVAGAPTQREEGDLWLSESVPFGIVRQDAKTLGEDGVEISSYVIRMTEKGSEELTTNPVEPVVAEPESPKLPSVVTLVEGYQTERYALDITPVPGSGGRKLDITLRNKSADEITVKLRNGNVDLPGSAPVSELNIEIGESIEVVVPAEGSSPPFMVYQRGSYGPVEGTFTLSYYEGTAYYSGSVTLDALKK